MKVTPKDGRLYAEVTLRDVVEHTKDLSGLPMLTEVKRLYDENDKLRELAKLMHETIKDLQATFDVGVVAGGVTLDAEYFEHELRELGIEVE